MDNVRTVKANNNDDDVLTSICWCKLPFLIDPTEKRVVFTGTGERCRFCHVDLAERKKAQSY